LSPADIVRIALFSTATFGAGSSSAVIDQSIATPAAMPAAIVQMVPDKSVAADAEVTSSASLPVVIVGPMPVPTVEPVAERTATHVVEVKPAATPIPAGTKVVAETPRALQAPIARSAAKYGIPADVLSAALARESANFKDKYVYGYHVDGTGRGVAGIDKQYHPEVSDAQAFDPVFSIDWEAQQLSQLAKKNGGDIYSALREYNGGPNFASSRIGYEGRTVSELTRAHADAIMAHASKAVTVS
jgi:hypothetical protein